MGYARWMTLAFGPLLIIGFLYRFTMWENGAELAASESPINQSSSRPVLDQSEMESACRQSANGLKPLLDSRCNVITRVPYVLAGDLSEEHLDRIYHETILPTSVALSTSYFDTKPTEPILILLFSSESLYRKHAEEFDGRNQANYHGYYQRTDRRILLNYGTGNGTLAHELTHALGHFDFPEMPEWFDEGLASLHEQSRFSKDSLRLEGISNWRLNYLLPYLKRNRLQSLAHLMNTRTVRNGNEAIHYAHARYFCLYLQSRGLLSPFYRKFRHSVELDPTGTDALCSLLQVKSIDQIDSEFQSWLKDQPLQKTK